MCAPATAALLLAALTALPCRGIDADTYSRINTQPEIEHNDKSQTITKLYQMLHSTSEIHNQSQTINSIDYINGPTTEFFYQSVATSTNQKNINQIDELDETNVADNVKVGAKTLTEDIKLDKDVKRKKKRTVRVLRGDFDMTTIDEGRVHHVTTSVHPSSLPLAMERKKKPGETGSSAPLLNYIFDTYSTTHNHNHRNDRSGSGNSIYTATGPEAEAFVGTTAHLDCKVDALHDKLVSWVRRKNEEEPMELLTTGTQLYTADERYSARFIPPDIWRLEVKQVRSSDAALYDCQLSAHPPRTARVTLRVPEVSVRIVDGAGAEVSEQVCEVGSTVALRCEVRGLKMEGGPSLLWYRRDYLLNDDTTRGGISVRTEFGLNGANSVLRVARVRNDDAGRYSCSVARAPPNSPPPAHVLLHVIKGESLAELHQGGVAVSTCAHLLNVLTVLALYTLFS